MTTFSIQRLARGDGSSIALYTWPAPPVIKAAVQLVHGLAEHAGRYDRFAQGLTRAGYAVFGSDHRGHGQTARGPQELGYFADEAGFARVVDDVYAVNRYIAAQLPKVPRVLFAHSFGSFAAQAYLGQHGDSIAAAVLSGSNTGDGKLAYLGRTVAAAERFRLGPTGRSPILQALSFGSYNKAFAPTRTDNDWLSRDAAEVDKYTADPLCGFAITTQGWADLFQGLIEIEKPALIARIPKTLPIYVFAGERDPVGHAGRGPRKLARVYQRAGLAHVTLKLYPEARHELLNETNRDEVVADLIAWLDQQVTPAAAAEAS